MRLLSWLPVLNCPCPSLTIQDCLISWGWGEARKRNDYQPHAKRSRRTSLQSEIKTNREAVSRACNKRLPRL